MTNVYDNVLFKNVLFIGFGAAFFGPSFMPFGVNDKMSIGMLLMSSFFVLGTLVYKKEGYDMRIPIAALMLVFGVYFMLWRPLAEPIACAC